MTCYGSWYSWNVKKFECYYGCGLFLVEQACGLLGAAIALSSSNFLLPSFDVVAVLVAATSRTPSPYKTNCDNSHPLPYLILTNYINRRNLTLMYIALYLEILLVLETRLINKTIYKIVIVI